MVGEVSCLTWLVRMHLGVDISSKFELGVLYVATNVIVSPLVLLKSGLNAAFTTGVAFCGVTGTGREVALRVVEETVGVVERERQWEWEV